MTERSTILITGAAGFIGLRLGRELVARGHTVIGFDLATPPDAAFPIACGDVRDGEAIARLCAAHSVDRIVHGGGISGRGVSRSDRQGTLDVNIRGTVAVLETAHRYAIRKVVLCSSGSVYGRAEKDPITEDVALEPVNAYGASKVASEAILHSYAAECGVDAVALRIMQAYGPFRQTKCNIRAMVHAAVAGERAMLVHGPDARFQYVYIDDVVEALAAALFSGRLPRKAYNVSGEASMTLREVVAIAKSVLPKLEVEFADNPLSSEYRLGHIDQTAIERDFGYRPRFELARGIRDYADSVAQRANHRR